MKTLVVVLLSFIASNAFASSADSGKCPWKMPFTIKVHGIGETHRWEDSRYPVHGGYIEQDTDYGYQSSTKDFLVTVDTERADYNYNPSIEYSLIGDVLLFSINDSANFFYGKTIITIEFAPDKDSIISLGYSRQDTMNINNTVPYSFDDDEFQITQLSFDDTSIFTADSFIRSHAVVMVSNDENRMYVGRANYDYQYSDFTASSVTLSGIFRPTAFSNPAAVEELPPPPRSLAIHTSNGSTACSFDISDQARDLEIFSPLGIEVASMSIPPNRQEATLPRLQPGFYFIRLGSSVAKIVVAE